MRNRWGISLGRVVLLKSISLGLVFSVFLTASGCEPLRKKFTRKKKEGQEQKEFIPVLDPIDYPARSESPAQIYRYHFSMWQIWHKDLLTTLEEKGSDKKIHYLVEQLLLHMGEMKKLLPADQQAPFNEHYQEMETMKDRFQQPAAVRNDDITRRQLDRLGKAMRREFKSALAEEEPEE